MSDVGQGDCYDYSFGAVCVGKGLTRFRLWAPSARQVCLELDGQPARPMEAVAQGFHELTCACAPGTRYRYHVDGTLRVPDPASRLQDGDIHDASIVSDTTAYSWRNKEWRGLPWEQTVLYEIHAGLAGGFRGVQERLADLSELGITAIELMPVADFPGPRNWGYDGVLPYAPDTAYGSPDDLRLLVDTAHGMGMQVFLDVVYNHFGPEGNYLSGYAPEFFREDRMTPWGPAIDFRRNQVRAFFAENALYWLREYRFDGLRLDAVHAISEPGWLPEMADFVRSHLDPGRHVHLVLENDDNAASLLGKGFDAQWNDDAHHVLHRILTGESQGYYSAYGGDCAGELARCLGEGFLYQGQPSAWRDGRPRGEPSAGLPPSAFVFFLQNHDQTGNRAFGERLTTLCARKPDALRAAIALQLLAPHIPLVFMGEEYGSTAPFLYFTSFNDAELATAVREGRRNEFAAFPAFSDPQARDRIPDPNDEHAWEQSRALPGLRGAGGVQWREEYRALLAARREFISPWLRGAKNLFAEVAGPLAVRAGWRLGNGSVLRIYCNLSSDEVALKTGMSAEERIFSSMGGHAEAALREGGMAACSTVATLEPCHRPEQVGGPGNGARA
ncbi:malto-oligosyltrehalose trehalohydrolase [Pollutimonas sp. M17]|uniref:malto-oligosyltrehalose trehalohydrolase n=1 Tax=Pollutimonas sp. M17 TaxID=2962065 RepID=UPI0021F4374A|nr:malto-oligosyltrehalose trehalohydrolase [Pollutimonas sp. M17]UYO93483.1 malto-oligosyltrehalose trehalohydrolase [Pollutimonas sp. M17]